MYVLNADAARAGDTVGAYITETGKYIGRFTRAERLISRDKGTHGVGFSFKAEDGREARFDVWTKRADDSPLSGLNTINAMMTCLQLRELRDIPCSVKKWNFDQQADETVIVQCFNALMMVDIGLLLRSEEYEKTDKNGVLTGETGWRMGIMAAFQAKTELMATEILARKTTPTMLAQVIPSLRDKPLKKNSARQPVATREQSALSAAGFPDDDVPF